jgi:hypothetical protein
LLLIYFEIPCIKMVIMIIMYIIIIIIIIINENVNVITHNHYLQKREIRSKILT